MDSPLSLRPFLRRGFLAAFFLLLSAFALGQSTTGTIEGRVLNTRNGEYLEKARVTVLGTRLEVFTDATGQYRLTGVPVGEARVRVFHTGLAPQTISVSVGAGQIVTRDFDLIGADRTPGPSDGTVRLDQFVVATSKEMEGAAIAINEQRFASNIVNVVAADEFGHIAEGNVGEFLKFLPGMAIDFVGGDARTISMGGVPSGNVPVTVGGFNLASAASSGTGRSVELEQVSINNIARIEVYHSPTPESPGSALAGGVNMVPRGAFERSKPQFNGSVYLMMRDAERSLRKTPGPIREPSYKIHPGLDFSWVVPVNKRFGFTLSGGTTSQYTMQDFMVNTWRGAGNATNVAATALNGYPDTTPDQPYLSNYQVRDGTKVTTRSSLGTTLDYKLSRHARLAFSFQYAFFDAMFNNRSLTFNTNRVLPGNFSTRDTLGDRGFGEITVGNGAREKSGTTFMPTLRFFHDGPIWKVDAGAGYSHASNHYRDIDKGYFNGASARRTGVTVRFRDIFYLRPGRIEVTEGPNDTPVDPYDLRSYVLNTSSSDFRESSDLQRSAFANVRRDFEVRRVPISLKLGADIRESARDIRGGTVPYTHRGADGRTSTTPADPLGTDDGAAFLLDEVFSQRTGPYGFPKIQWLSNFKAWEYYSANPSHYTIDQNAAYRNAVNLSKRASEIISSAYLRGDLAFLDRRLKIVGGIRAEQTNVDAQGPLTDPTGNYRRDANGEVIPQRDANGNLIFTGTGVNRIPAPTLIEPTTINGVSNALAVSRLTLLDRQQQVNKEYLRWFPNINASYNIRENLIGRVSYYYSIGRPDFNQYAGGLTLPDTELPPNSSNNRIAVNNAGIKAWSAKTTRIRFEYYFERVGQISVGGFRRDFRNFFGSIVLPATPEFLALYSLDPEIYGEYPVSTNYNLDSTVRMQGLEFDYKQTLTFLPHWARGVQVFANTTATRATGIASSNFSGYIPRIYNWGVSLSRPQYNLRMNWNYRGRQRRGLIAAGRSIEPSTYDWGSKRLYIDISGEYTFYKRFAVFGSLRNVNDATEDIERAGPSTPAHAQFRQREDFGSLWTFGVKGTF
jgi:TonB-dependent receptor